MRQLPDTRPSLEKETPMTTTPTPLDAALKLARLNTTARVKGLSFRVKDMDVDTLVDLNDALDGFRAQQSRKRREAEQR